MKVIIGYLRAARNYWNYSKGHHDIIDFGTAFLVIGCTIAAIMYLVYWLFS